MAVDLQARLKAFAKLVSEKSLVDLVGTIWKNDRQFTYPAFARTAEIVRSKIQNWGIEGEICHLPADGKTMYGDWKMPLAWDCTSATLEIVSPRVKNRVIADRKDRPTHTIMWCGPTPPEGITADVVRIEDRKELRKKLSAVKNKIVYTPSHPMEFKAILVKAGALAVVTSYCRNRELLPEATFWFNGWSDNPTGWAFHADDTPLPGMAISGTTGAELDALLKHGRVTLKMTVASRYFEGTLPIVSGFIPGSGKDEILAIGHAMEQGANDNASGCAVILESLRAIKSSSKLKALPPLKRGVRGVLTNECYGTIGYAAKNPEIMLRLVAALNWDTVGRYQESATAIFRQHRCADASASVIDTLIGMLMDSWLHKTLPFAKTRRDMAFALTDNAYNDPDIGVPCAYVDSQDRFWHTSADTLDTIHGPTLHAFAVISATYLHFLASAGAEEILFLADHTLREYGKRIDATTSTYAVQLREKSANKPQVLAKAFDHLDYILLICSRTLRAALMLIPKSEQHDADMELNRLIGHARNRVKLEQQHLKSLAGCAPGELKPVRGISDIAKLRPRKKFIGTPSYEGLKQRSLPGAGSPTWNAPLQCAMFWARGELTVAEILRRVAYEHGRDLSELLAEHFRYMAKHGLLEWKEERSTP